MNHELLFSYGTLKSESVQLDTFGRKLAGQIDALVGYRVTLIPINDPSVVANTGDTHYRNVEFTGNANHAVEGMAFEVTVQEMELADSYEAPARYRRNLVRLRSGNNAWVYLRDSES